MSPTMLKTFNDEQKGKVPPPYYCPTWGFILQKICAERDKSFLDSV